jgi:putative oxidoreductase
MNAATATARPADRPGGRANTLLWAAQLALAAFFAAAAVPKLPGAHTAVTMFGQIGAGPWLRYLVGAAELAGAAGLLIPRLAGLAAAGLAADMAGASIINAAVLHSAAVTMTVPLCAAFTLIATTRRAQIRNLAATITRRRQPLARPQAFRQNDQDRRPS